MRFLWSSKNEKKLTYCHFIWNWVDEVNLLPNHDWLARQKMAFPRYSQINFHSVGFWQIECLMMNPIIVAQISQRMFDPFAEWIMDKPIMLQKNFLWYWLFDRWGRSLHWPDWQSLYHQWCWPHCTFSTGKNHKTTFWGYFWLKYWIKKSFTFWGLWNIYPKFVLKLHKKLEKCQYSYWERNGNTIGTFIDKSRLKVGPTFYMFFCKKGQILKSFIILHQMDIQNSLIQKLLIIMIMMTYSLNHLYSNSNYSIRLDKNLLLFWQFSIYSITSQLGPGRWPGKNWWAYFTHLDILRYTKFSLPWPIWVLEFGVSQGQRSRRRGHACVKNLPWVGRKSCAKFGGDWSCSSGVKRGHRYIHTNSQFYIYRLRFFWFLNSFFNLFFTIDVQEPPLLWMLKILEKKGYYPPENKVLDFEWLGDYSDNCIRTHGVPDSHYPYTQYHGFQKVQWLGGVRLG